MKPKSTQFAAIWVMIIIYALGINAQISSSHSSDEIDSENQLIGKVQHAENVPLDRTNSDTGKLESHVNGDVSGWLDEPIILSPTEVISSNKLTATSGNVTKTANSPATKAPITKAPATEAPTTKTSTTKDPTTVKPAAVTKKVTTTKAPEVATKKPDITSKTPGVTTKKPTAAPASNPTPGATVKPGGTTTKTPGKAELKNGKKSFWMFQLIICCVMFVLSIIAIVTSCLAIRDLNKTKKRISDVQTMATTTMTA